MKKTTDEIKKLFLMFQTIYLVKWTNCFPNSEVLEIAMEQWQLGLTGINNEAISKAMNHCRMNLEWPPSIAEFIGLCEQESGVPSFEIAFRDAIRRDFHHPIIEYAFNKVGSWALSHDYEKELRIKFKTAYDEAIKMMRNRNLLMLENQNEATNG